jgi:hypothetical protein
MDPNDLICDALPLGTLCYGGRKAISYAKFYSRLRDAFDLRL